MDNKESYCSCCGVAKSKYEAHGHDKECTWYEDEMYKLAEKWLSDTEYFNHPFKKYRNDDGSFRPVELRYDWKKRYDLIVGFLLGGK